MSDINFVLVETKDNGLANQFDNTIMNVDIVHMYNSNAKNSKFIITDLAGNIIEIPFYASWILRHKFDAHHKNENIFSSNAKVNNKVVYTYARLFIDTSMRDSRAGVVNIMYHIQNEMTVNPVYDEVYEGKFTIDINRWKEVLELEG